MQWMITAHYAQSYVQVLLSTGLRTTSFQKHGLRSCYTRGGL